MKRVQAGCIKQTLVFSVMDGKGTAAERKEIEGEVRRYKSSLTSTRTKHKILSEETQPDGSIVIEIVKEYNGQKVGHYLD